MASDEKGIPPPKISAKAVNRGGRPRKFPPGEAKERKAAAQKQNRGPKSSRPAPGTFQFIPYEPPGTEPSLSCPAPTVKNEQELHGTTSEAASIPPLQRLQSVQAITPHGHPAWEDLAPIGTIASGKQRTGASHPSADNPLDLDNTTLEVATILSKLSIDTAVPLRDANAQRSGVESTSPGSGLELTPAINDGQTGMSSLSSRYQPKSDEESVETSTASDTREHSLWCDEDNSDSDYGCVVPSPTSLSFKDERELRNEAMMMKPESPSPISSRASYFADSQSDADNEEGGVLEDKNTTSEAKSPDSVRDDIALQLATQLYAFQGCTKEKQELNA